jgi:alkyl hydroperoxide reductase subunit AhpC
MLAVGDAFPQFKVKACVNNEKTGFVEIHNDTHKGKGVVYFFYPKDVRPGHHVPLGARLPARHVHRRSARHHSVVGVLSPERGAQRPETLRVLDAIQSKEYCPCNWEKGRPTLKE